MSSTPPLSGYAGEQSTAGNPSVDRVVRGAHETVDRVAAKVAPALDRLSSSASNATANVQARLDDMYALHEEWMESAREQVRAQPLAAVGVALLAGWLIGRWMR